MNKLFQRIPLPVKLMLISIIPLAFIVYFAIQLMNEREKRIVMIDSLMKNIEVTPDIVKAVTALQAERWAAINYTLQKESSVNEMQLLRGNFNNSLVPLDAFFSSEDKEYRKHALLDKLDDYRGQIDRREISVEQVMQRYTDIAAGLWKYMPSAEDAPLLKTISSDLTGQRLLIENYTYLALLRANIYYFLEKNNETSEDAARMYHFYSLYTASQDAFLSQAPPEAVKKYKQLIKGDTLAYTMSIIQKSVATRSMVLTHADADHWALVATAGVHSLMQLHSDMLATLKKKNTEAYETEQDERRRQLIILTLIVVVVSLFVFFTIKTISDSLVRLKGAAEQIASGATGVSLPVRSNDVIGSLTRSIATVDHSYQVMATAADAIGRGDFDVPVIPRSKEDLLGNALANMRNDLKKFTDESKEEVWIQTGVTKVNDRIRGEKDMVTLCREVLSGLASYLDVPVALIYTSEHDVLYYQSSYGVQDTSAVRKRIPFGETLLGEAAVKKEPLYLSEVPVDFVKVSTGSGESRPTYIVLYPLTHNNVLYGVIEIGSFTPFKEACRTLMRRISDHIAIAMQTARSRAQLQVLLEQTQAQTEELRVQHNELENANSELEAQAQKLQASEEELRVQQEELLEANRELEERAKLLEERNQVILERNLEIQRKAEELALSTKYKSEFLANMSHELRTPLNSILLLSRLLSENNEKNLDEEQIEYARVINNSGQGLLGLIDEILDLSKIESGKMTLEYLEVPISSITKDMQSIFGPMAKEKGIEFRVDITKEVPSKISTDKMRLEQILRNLISNALKFTSKGSVVLGIFTPKGKEGTIGFSVKDTGIGIPKEKQQIVFEAFQQADGSTRRKFGGTGLGLSISRELSRLLGGDISLKSQPGEGSEFTLFIPVEKPERAAEEEIIPPAPKSLFTAPEKKEETAPSPAASIRTEDIPHDVPDDRDNVKPGDKVILVVEDDTGFARALVKFTKEQGYKVIVAVRGDYAVPFAIRFKPMGILLDIQLPVKDGWQVMDELKKDPATRHIPVHMMSSREAKKESISKGAVDFINKPFAFEQMGDALQKLEDVLNKAARKVLIVEDNPKHAEALSYFLGSYKINSEVYTSIDEGGEALKRKDVDCVILDMGIPDQKAYETLEEIRKNPEFADVPIIIFTGKYLSKAEEERIHKYADSIVIKTAHSYKRMLDEVGLFLHVVEENRDERAKHTVNKLRSLEQVLENKTALIVDDDVRNVFSLAKALENHKMKVLSATDGAEALQQMEENPSIDIVLMDMMMPEMDGYEATARIRQHQRFKKIPVIAVTAKAMAGDREKCIEAGASDYISKPVDIDQLLSLLRVWLYDK
jgi:signal transduction histidine kinase/CheY-like chemotaxis protein